MNPRMLILYADLHLNLYELALARGDTERADECLRRAGDAVDRLTEWEVDHAPNPVHG